MHSIIFKNEFLLFLTNNPDKDKNKIHSKPFDKKSFSDVPNN